MILEGYPNTTTPLEVRQQDGETRLAGRFPYSSIAILSDGGRRGRPRKEQFAPGAFDFSINEPESEIHLLIGHSFDRPLASKRNGTLSFNDTPKALEFEATITPEVQSTSYWADIRALISSGLAVGVSPGFRLPPERAVARELAERIEEEGLDPGNGMHRAIIRTILQAILVEMSIVTRPAYPETQIQARSWDVAEPSRATRRRLLL